MQARLRVAARRASTSLCLKHRSGCRGARTQVRRSALQDDDTKLRSSAKAVKPASSITTLSRDTGSGPGFSKEILKKIAILVGLITVARIGVYDRLPGVDIAKFSQAVSSNGLLGYIDSISGGSISNVGVFTLGIIPAINASIFLQVLSTAFPELKKLQREEGPQGRSRYQLYTKLATLAFATAQAFGQLTALRISSSARCAALGHVVALGTPFVFDSFTPFGSYVPDWSPEWLLSNAIALVAGAMITLQLADYITEQKLGNGTSILIFASIASSLPVSISAAFTQASGSGSSSSIAVYIIAFLVTAYGIVMVQNAERRVPINYANRYDAGSLSKQAYLPFKVNATGIMPVIFSTSILALPSGLANFAQIEALKGPAQALSSGGSLYLPANVILIVLINYYYTFLQLDPNDVSNQLKRQGASVPGVRPGKATAEFVTDRLTNMSVLGSVFLGTLSAAPALTEAITNVPALRGFAGTSVLIIVGVATDTARRIRAEKQMAKYGDVDRLYDKL